MNSCPRTIHHRLPSYPGVTSYQGVTSCPGKNRLRPARPRGRSSVMTLLVFSVLLAACSMPEQPLSELPPKDFEPGVRIAFGSCNEQNRSQDYWSGMTDYYDAGPGFPDVWIWAGDNVYADTEELAVMKQAYARVLDGPYGQFAQRCRASGCNIVGTWDDHDFGANNLRGYVSPGPLPEDSPFRRISKAERKAALIEFLGEPSASRTAAREQVYAAYDFVRPQLRVRVNVLDVRYDRQRGGRKILGGEQWAWLESKLLDDAIDLQLVVSSSQVLRLDPSKDTWGEFPEERERLLGLIARSPAQGVVLLSGDIHAGEVSRLGSDQERRFGIGYPLYEITSSGLNKVRCLLGVCHYGWQNHYQLGLAIAPNFGELAIARRNHDIVVWAAIRSTDSPAGKPLLGKVIHFSGEH